MRYVHDDTEVIMVVEDDAATIRTAFTIVTYSSQEDAIDYFIENGIDYSILSGH